MPVGQVWLSPTDAPTLNREPWGLGIVDLRIGHVKTKTGHVYGSDGVAYGGQVPRHGITTVGRLDGIRRCLTNKDISRWPRLQGGAVSGQRHWSAYDCPHAPATDARDETLRDDALRDDACYL